MADAATLKISNQKNGHMGQTLHQEGTGSRGAVASLARQLDHILINNRSEENLLCDVFYKATWTAIQSAEIVAAVRTAAKSLKPQDKGIYPDLIGAHSLRAGGAMALKIMGYLESTIRKFGRWVSDTWQSVATKMSTPILYHNITFIEPASPSSTATAPTA